MRKELGEVTTVVIAHRLTTIRDADKICVLVKGSCHEEGSHEYLMENHPEGVYAGLINL
jgi:ABC-type transport system involved in Fe-S cluster assembly fused permease/ATPase subunit